VKVACSAANIVRLHSNSKHTTATTLFFTSSSFEFAPGWADCHEQLDWGKQRCSLTDPGCLLW
jgi:hypothetical protein